MYKLTAPNNGTVFGFPAGTFARISPELTLTQNINRKYTVKFLLTSLNTRVNLMGNSGIIGTASCMVAVEPDGSVIYLTSGGGNYTALPANTIGVNTWYELSISEFDGSAGNGAVTLNGVVLNSAPAIQFGPWVLGFIGLGPTQYDPGINQSTVLFEYIKLYQSNALVAEFSFDTIPTTNPVPAKFGAYTVTFNSPDTMYWYTANKGSGAITPALDLSAPTWELEVDFRPSRTKFRPGTIQPILTSDGCTKGLFISQHGSVFFSEDIDVDNPTKHIYPAVVAWDVGNQNYWASSSAVSFGTSQAVWNVSIQFAMTQELIDRMKAINGSIQFFHHINNTALINYVSTDSAGTVEVRISTASGGQVAAFTTTLPAADTFITLELDSTGTNWVAKENGVAKATIASPTGHTMPTVNALCVVNTIFGSDDTMSRVLYVDRAAVKVGTVFQWFYDKNGFNPFYESIEQTSAFTAGQSKRGLWFDRAAAKTASGFLRMSTQAYDPRGKTHTTFWEYVANYGDWFESQDRLKLIFEKTATSIDIYATTKTVKIAENTATGKGPRNNTANYTKLLASVNSMTALTELFGRGAADVFEVAFLSGGVQSRWQPNAAGTALVDTLGNRANITATGFTAVNIPTPGITVQPTGATYTKLSDVPFTSLLSANPYVTVEISGTVFSNDTNLASGQGKTLTIKAAPGQEFAGDFLDDTKARVMIYNNSTTGQLRITGDTDVVNIQDIMLCSTHGAAKPTIIIAGTTAALGKRFNLSRVGISTVQNTQATISDAFCISTIVDTIVTRFGREAFMFAHASSVIKNCLAVGQSFINTSTRAIHAITSGMKIQNSAVCRDGTNASNDYYYTGTSRLEACASNSRQADIAISKFQFVNFNELDFRIKPTDSLYLGNISAFSPLPPAPTETVQFNKGSVLGLEVKNTSPYSNYTLISLIQEIIQGFQSTSTITSARQSTKEVIKQFSALASVASTRLSEIGITSQFSTGLTASSTRQTSKEISKPFNTTLSKSGSAGVSSKTVTKGTATAVQALLAMNYELALGITGTFASASSIGWTMLANKSITKGSVSTASMALVATARKETTKGFGSTAQVTRAGTQQKTIQVSYSTTAIKSGVTSGSKSVTQGHSSTGQISTSRDAQKTAIGNYATNVYIYRWNEYQLLYEILGTFHSALNALSGGAVGAKTVTKSTDTNSAISTVRTTSKQVTTVFTDTAAISANYTVGKHVALPLTSTTMYAGTNYSVEKTSFSGYNTVLVATMEVVGTAKDLVKDFVSYVTESRSQSDYSTNTESYIQYALNIDKNMAEYESSSESEFSLGSVEFVTSTRYETTSTSLVRY